MASFAMPSFLPPEMPVSDFLLSLAAASIQFAASILLVTKSQWVIGFGWCFQGAIVAAFMIGYLSAVRFLLNWRSRRQIGEDLNNLNVNFFAFAAPTILSVIIGAALGPKSVETLWVNGLLAMVACFLVDLSRAKVSSEVFPGVVQGMLMVSMLWMEDHSYWWWGSAVATIVLVSLVCQRQDNWAAIKKAQDEKEEAKQGEKKVSLEKAEGEGKKIEQQATNKVEEED